MTCKEKQYVQEKEVKSALGDRQIHQTACATYKAT